MSETFVGVDPGPITGIVRLTVRDGRLVDVVAAQVTYTEAGRVIQALDGGVLQSTVALERFVVGRQSMRSGNDGEITRLVLGMVAGLFPGYCVQRSASEVKPWASDERLAHAGLLEPTKGMRHARDAGRHALYAAVKAEALPDPRSRRWSA